MPKFAITGPDGKKYNITGDTPEGAMNALRGYLVDKQSAFEQAQPYEQPDMPAGMVLDPDTGRVIDTTQEAEIRRQRGGVGQYTSDVAGQVLAGAPFVGEYMDEAAGLVGGEMAQERTRAKLANFEQHNPKTAMGARMAGGVLGSLPLAAAAGPAVVANAPASLVGQVGYGAALGGASNAVEGGIAGYGSGTDAPSRMNNAKSRALIGGGVGAILGGGVPLVAAGAKSATNKAADIAARIRGTKPDIGASKPATDVLQRTLDGDLAAGARNIRAAGDDAMLADAGPSASGLLDATVSRGGPGVRIASDAVDARAGRAAGAMGRALDSELGVPMGVKNAENALRTSTAPARAAGYKTAYDMPIDYADPRAMKLEESFKRIPGNVWAKANELIRVEGGVNKQILADIADDGTVSLKAMPDVRQLDYLTRALNDVADSADGAGKLGGTTHAGRAYGNLSRDIRGAVRELVPEYGHALDTAADPIARRNALRLGEKALRAGTTRDEIADAISGMSKAERAAMSQGVRSHIDDTMSNVTRAVSDGNMDAREAIKAARTLSSRATREKLETLIGKRAAGGMFGRIDEATKALELRANIAMNSKTMPRQEAARVIRESVEGGPIAQAAGGKPINAARSIMQTLTGHSPADELAKEDKVYAEIAKLLTGPRGKDAEKLLLELQKIMQVSGANEALSNRAGQAAGAGSYLLGTQSQKMLQ